MQRKKGFVKNRVFVIKKNIFFQIDFWKKEDIFDVYILKISKKTNFLFNDNLPLRGDMWICETYNRINFSISGLLAFKVQLKQELKSNEAHFQLNGSVTSGVLRTYMWWQGNKCILNVSVLCAAIGLWRPIVSMIMI